MKNVAVIFGLILVLGGLAGFLATPTTTEQPENSQAENAQPENTTNPPVAPEETVTLIPMMVGLVITACGLLAVAKPNSTPLALNAATGIALLGGMAAAGRTWDAIMRMVQGTAAAWNAATILAVLMALLCWGFVLMQIGSMSREGRVATETDDVAER